jgi:hypothetical protein
MRFKHLFLIGLLLGPLWAQDGPLILIDRIEATVNDALITRLDVDRARLFFPILQESGQSETDFRRLVLEELIDYKVLSLEFGDEVNLREEDFEQVQLGVIAKLGSLDVVYPLLRGYGMSWPDFKAFIRERVVYEKVIAERLETRAVVSYREIEAFYTEHYVPLQETLGLNPKSLVEMTPQIERHLSKKRSSDQLEGWLKEIRGRYRIEYRTGEA